jgi:hypothetical protein
VQKALTDFVTVAANCRDLQGRSKDPKKDELGAFFWKVADQSHSMAQGGETTQGLYAFSTTGELYGWMNDRDIPTLLALLAKARAAHAAAPPKKLTLAEPKPDAALEPPEGAAVVRVYSRVKPLPEGLAADDLNRSVGRDHLWILKSEIEAIEKAVEADGKCEVPRALAARIARWHLLDNVRGEPDRWMASEVKKASFTVTHLATLSGRTRAHLDGAFFMLAKAGKKGEDGRILGERGFEGTIEGELEIDPTKSRLTGLRLHARGKFWGESTYSLNAPKGKFPLELAFVLTGEKEPHVVSPQGLGDGRDVYLAPPVEE